MQDKYIHIISKAQARELGLRRFFMAEKCPKGHFEERFIRDGKCVECNRLICSKRYHAKMDADPARRQAIDEARKIASEKKSIVAEKSEVWNKLRMARQTAIISGSLTYHGRECSYGHGTERYTSGGNCIVCSSEFSASEHKKRYDKKYQEENKDRIQARNKEYQARTSKQRTISAIAWAKANPEKRKAISSAYSHRRRAAEKEGSSTIELMEWEKQAKKDCYWCGKKDLNKYHVDHYYPLSKGGRHAIENLVISCPQCNLRKSAKDPIAWAHENGRLL